MALGLAGSIAHRSQAFQRAGSHSHNARNVFIEMQDTYFPEILIVAIIWVFPIPPALHAKCTHLRLKLSQHTLGPAMIVCSKLLIILEKCYISNDEAMILLWQSTSLPRHVEICSIIIFYISYPFTLACIIVASGQWHSGTRESFSSTTKNRVLHFFLLHPFFFCHPCLHAPK